MSNLSKIKITLFNGIVDNKALKSPYTDGSFIFATQEFEDLKSAYFSLTKNCALSKPLDNDDPIKTYKKVNDLKKYIPYKLSSLIVDIVNIYDQNDYNFIINYFRENNYSCIIFKSSKFDNSYCYNIRILFRINLTNKNKFIKIFLEDLQNNLGSKGLVDLKSKSTSHYYKPCKSAILYYKENGKIINDSNVYITKVSDIIDNPFEENDKEETEILDQKKKYPKEFIDKCLELFFEEGYSIVPNKGNSIQFKKDNDKNYFWYPTNPFIMNHKDKDKKDSIFSAIKKTKEGKKWLKEQTKYKQEQELIKPYDLTQHKSYVICDERYLDLTKRNKIKLIQDFITSDKGVFKIKSAMGTAKSNVIHEIIKRVERKKEKIIIVSNRISVAMDFEDKYNIKTYQDYSTIASKESVIVQYDSLHKYNPKDYDVVIFDEYVSLLLHHRSNLGTNSNINAVKFKILSESKRVVIADAFLTGYEDKFFLGRDIFALYNNYRDEVKLFEYKNRDYFITKIIEKAKTLEDEEHMSCSFASKNILYVVEHELRKEGIKVISLTSETNDITKEIIYKKFKEDSHNAFQVILYTPTLTVGVSNLNKVKYHFHFDSGRGPDVISSLQMTKRSRTAEEIHYYIIEMQKYNDTDLNSINSITKDKISNFYKGKDKTLLVDIDYNTGELELTPLALYINKIEVFNNILENNHGNAFRLLLNYQFTTNISIIENKSKNINVQEKTRAIKHKMRQNKIELLEKYADCQWDYFEIEELQKKVAEKTPEEQIKLMMYEIEQKLMKKPTRSQLKQIAKLEIENEFKFINYVKNMKIMMDPDFDVYAKYELSNTLSDELQSLQNKEQIQFLQYILRLPYDFILENNYEKKDIQVINDKLNIGKKFEKFLLQLGYIWKEGKLEADTRIYKFISFI